MRQGATEPSGIGTIVVATGGTSDLPVAEEAALTAETPGNQVTRLYDVGVAGLHRLPAHMEEIMSASVIIVLAGLESAKHGAIRDVIYSMEELRYENTIHRLRYGLRGGYALRRTV